jgi:hypothetical protein
MVNAVTGYPETRELHTHTHIMKQQTNVAKGSNKPQSRPSLSELNRGNLQGAKASVRYCLAPICIQLCTQCSSRAQHLPDECLESKSGSSRFRAWRVSNVQSTDSTHESVKGKRGGCVQVPDKCIWCRTHSNNFKRC